MHVTIFSQQVHKLIEGNVLHAIEGFLPVHKVMQAAHRQHLLSEMIERLRVDQNRKREVLDAAVRSHCQELHMLFIGQKGGCVVEMKETPVMTSAILRAMLCNKREDVLAFQKGFCNAGVSRERGEDGILGEVGRLQFETTVGLSSLQ